MSFDPQALFNLLPAILRIRDLAQTSVSPGLLLPSERAALADLEAKIAASIPLSAAEQQQFTQLQQRALAGPHASLLAVFAEQFALLQEDIDQLYDDQFIETCANWVVPYIGDLIGYRTLNGVAPEVASPRAEVAHTIAYRRRKGTITMLEQLARDVTDWNATAVEFFQRLIVTQYMNHHPAAMPGDRRTFADGSRWSARARPSIPSCTRSMCGGSPAAADVTTSRISDSFSGGSTPFRSAARRPCA